MTIDEIAAVINAQFASAEELAVALRLLDARMDIEIANGVQRIAQAQAETATAQAQAAIQVAQANALAAQAAFDQIVAQLAGTN
jgi:hypothetical protein